MIFYIVLAVALAMDAVAVSFSCSLVNPPPSRSSLLRMSLAFGLFQALMPLLGWLLGRRLLFIIAPVDHWVAAALLVALGGRMIWSSLNRRRECSPFDPSRWGPLLLLAVATSIDALAVGLSFAFLETKIWTAVAVIGTVTFLLASLAAFFGKKIASASSLRLEVAAGFILIVIAMRILWVHLTGASGSF